MANPQIENGYTAVANEILDNLYKFSLNIIYLSRQPVREVKVPRPGKYV